MQCGTADEKESISALHIFMNENRQISHCWLRSNFDRSTFWLKNPRIFRRLAISTFHAFVTLLAFQLRLFMGLEFRVWSLLLANGAMDLGHREYTQFHPYLSSSLLFFSFLILVIGGPDLIIWFKFLVPVFFFIYSPLQFPDPAGTHQGN